MTKTRKFECEVCGSLTRRSDRLCRECAPQDEYQYREQALEDYERLISTGWPYSDTDDEDE